MIEILTQRKKELQEMYKRKPDIDTVIRLRENLIMIRRYKRLLEAEVDAAGFREELGNLVALMAGLESVSTDTQYAGNGTAGIQNETKPTGFFFQMPPHGVGQKTTGENNLS